MDISVEALPHALNKNLTELKKIIVYKSDVAESEEPVEKLLVQSSSAIYILSVDNSASTDEEMTEIQISEVITEGTTIMAPVSLVQSNNGESSDRSYFVTRSYSEDPIIDTV